MPKKQKDSIEAPPDTPESAPVATSGDVAAEAQPTPEPIVDAGVLLYRDRSVTPRDNSVTEGKANFASVMQALREAAPDVALEGA